MAPSVMEVGAPEAAIFYCGRALELLTREARERHETAVPNVFSNLIRLGQWGWISSEQATILHALRRLANAARHVTRDLNEQDARTALGLSASLVRWAKHLKLIPDGAHLPLPAHLEGIALIVRVEEGPTALPALREAWDDGQSAFVESPVTAALYAELLDSTGATQEAAEVLRVSRARHPGDLRLMQLDALVTRRQGDDARALDLLDQALALGRKDPETRGLLAATYKRKSQRLSDSGDTAGAREYAERSLREYRAAWRASDKTSTYTGINAATLSALLGDTEGASRIAARLLDGYHSRPGSSGATPRFADYWDAATYAEALLIAGEIDDARRAYQSAFQQAPDRQTWVDSTTDQLRQLLTALNGQNLDDFLGA